MQWRFVALFAVFGGEHKADFNYALSEAAQRADDNFLQALLKPFPRIDVVHANDECPVFVGNKTSSAEPGVESLSRQLKLEFAQGRLPEFGRAVRSRVHRVGFYLAGMAEQRAQQSALASPVCAPQGVNQ